VYSRNELLGKIVEESRDFAIERDVGTPIAAVVGEGLEVEVVSGDREARGEVFLDPLEPGELLIGEGRATLSLLGNPIAEPFVDGERVGDQVTVGFDGLLNK